jgi:hypothetical protein
VEFAPLGRIRVGVDDGGNERVRETHAVAVELEQAAVDRRGERGRRIHGSDARLDEGHRRPRKRRCRQGDPVCLRREIGESHAEERTQGAGNGEGLSPAERDVVLRETPGQLDGEVRVATGRGLQLPKRGWPKMDVEAGAYESSKRVTVERPDEEASDCLGRERLVKCERHVGLGPAAREDEADRLGAQAPCGELQGARRRSVEPLEVVDSDYEGSGGGERSEHAEDAERDCSRKRRRSLGIDLQECDLESPALWNGQLGGRRIGNLLEQVAERSEGELGLRLDRPAGEHAVRAVERPQDRFSPEGRLADPGVALKQEADWAGGHCVEKSRELVELLLASDQCGFLDHVTPPASGKHGTLAGKSASRKPPQPTAVRDVRLCWSLAMRARGPTATSDRGLQGSQSAAVSWNLSNSLGASSAHVREGAPPRWLRLPRLVLW